MKGLTQIILGLAVLVIQIFLSGFLTIDRVRPDFLLIFVIYVSIMKGSLAGVVFGFGLGLLEDILSAGSFLGLAPLTKSITGFLAGKLHGRFARMSPLVFHGFWIGIVLIHFAFYLYIQLQTLFESSPFVFWETWFFTAIYTLVFILILQLIIPLPYLASLAPGKES